MSEGEVVEQLVEFTTILLAGVSVLFTVVSAYIAALNYFIGAANFLARFFSFAFVALVLCFLLSVMAGAQSTQMGLVQRLRDLEAEGGLTAAGRAIVANSTPDARIAQWLGMTTSIDELVRIASWSVMGIIFLVLMYLTFVHRWKTDVIPVHITDA